MPPKPSNAWVSQDEPLATWVADLSPARGDGERLARWLSAVLDAGERNQVYVVIEAPTIGYGRSPGQSFSASLERRFRENGVVDLFQFARSGMREVDGGRFRVLSRLAYYDQHGSIVDDDIDDVGELLRRLRPDAVETAPGLVKRGPPIWASGPRINVRRPEETVWDLAPAAARVRFSILSDIWLPFVRGFLEPEFDDALRYDNRPLATRHTPRFNAFLQAARDATTSAAGEWMLDTEETRRNVAYMLRNDGIDLEAQPPPTIRVLQ